MTERELLISPRIVAAPDPVLRQVAEPVKDFSATASLVRRLREAMRFSAAQGRPAAGLAAPQIGESVRVFVLTDDPEAFVNPRIVRKTKEEEIAAEGCLSLPVDEIVEVARPVSVQIAALNERGGKRFVTLGGFAARAAQHEIDHLDGILITDRRAA